MGGTSGSTHYGRRPSDVAEQVRRHHEVPQFAGGLPNDVDIGGEQEVIVATIAHNLSKDHRVAVILQ